MLVEKMVAPLFEANTYIMVPAGSTSALVVDPGDGHCQEILEFASSRGLSIEAVLCTHGHPDHIWDAAAIAGDAPVYIPAPDMTWMDNPTGQGHPLIDMIALMVSHPYERAKNIVALGHSAANDGFSPIEGLAMRMVMAPGHSQGSALFLFEGPVESGNIAQTVGDANLFALGGDVIFAGGIGRTDLPGSDERQMMHSLRTLQNVIDPATWLLPGHGALTTMGEEKASNPYLRQARYQG